MTMWVMIVMVLVMTGIAALKKKKKKKNEFAKLLSINKKTNMLQNNAKQRHQHCCVTAHLCYNPRR